MGLTKTGLIDKIAEGTELSKREATDAVEWMLRSIENELRQGGDVTITGFGKFSVSARAQRTGVNPRTGEKMTIPAANVPRFSAGSKLKEAVNS